MYAGEHTQDGADGRWTRLVSGRAGGIVSVENSAQTTSSTINSQLEEARDLLGEARDSAGKQGARNHEDAKTHARRIKAILQEMHSSAPSHEAKDHINRAIQSCDNCLAVEHSEAGANNDMLKHLSEAEIHLGHAETHMSKTPPLRGRHHMPAHLIHLLEHEHGIEVHQ